MTPKKISICIPTFNRADLLGATLESVARQTMKPDEVLIIDNASTDNTEVVVRPFEKYGFKYIKNEKNLGMAGNHNRCIELARNEYFTFMPSDDLMAPTWYEEWMRVIKDHDAGLYISPLTVMDNEYNLISAFPIFGQDTAISQPDVTRVLFKNYMTGVAPTGMFVYRKSVFQKIGGFDPADGSECDVKVGMKLLEHCDVYYHHKYLFVFREHLVRTFDTEKVDRTASFFIRFEKYLKMIKEIYKTRFHDDPKERYFLQGTLLMNLSNINLYLARFEFQKVIKSYQLVHHYFPDFLTKGEDWSAFARYQTEFIKRAFTLNRAPQEAAAQLGWIQELTSHEDI